MKTFDDTLVVFQETVAESGKKPESGGDGEGEGNATSDTCDGSENDKSDMLNSALPPTDRKQHRLSELHKLKANCKPEQLNVIRQHCEVGIPTYLWLYLVQDGIVLVKDCIADGIVLQTLVQDCIAGLLMNLSEQDFREVEEELNRAVCWYLSCERYWEDTIGDTRPFPWGLVFVLVMVLSLGLCLVYYVIWVLFE